MWRHHGRIKRSGPAHPRTRPTKMGAGVATSPRFPRVSRPRAPKDRLHVRPRAVSGMRVRPKPFPLPRLPQHGPKALPVRRSEGSSPPPPSESTGAGASVLPCRDRGLPSPSAAARSSRPALTSRAAAGGNRMSGSGLAGHSIRPSPSALACPAGLLPRLPRPLGRGFHLAAAVAAASSAALALHDPPPKARPAPAVPRDRPFPFPEPAVPGHTEKLSRFPSRGKSDAPVDYEDNGDGMI
jgi:hypothetical protein